MKNRLLWKLVAVNVLMVGAAIVVVWLALDSFAASYFMTLMKKYSIEPREVHDMFLEATHRAMLWAALASVALALLLNYLLIRRALRPLRQMARVTEDISGGDYSVRVAVTSADEVGRLGGAFNEMAAALEKDEKVRRATVVGIAHELRTPLTNLRGYLEAVRDGVVQADVATVELLEEETLRLMNLVEDLQKIARGELREGLRLRDLELAQVVEYELTFFRPRFERKRIQVQADLEAARGPVRADADKLLQVFQNLLENALRYAPTGGYLRIEAAREGEHQVRLTFANDGEGISAEDLPLVFEHFYRGEKSRSRDHGGAGIGLAIVKQWVKAHGGRVGVESDHETRFWVTLPLLAAPRPDAYQNLEEV